MSLRLEMQRKAFHMLSLCYLAGYKLIGYPEALTWLCVWTAAVAVMEFSRLRWPRLNAFLFSLLGSLSRASEREHVSGVLHTALGVLAVVFLFGADARLVSAAIWCVALGDAAAGVFGKAFGRTRLLGKKSLEGSAACLTACMLVCLAHGYAWRVALAGAVAAAALELAPTTRWYNDNLWLPLGAAGALRMFA